jgi:hypothetical protein
MAARRVGCRERTVDDVDVRVAGPAVEPHLERLEDLREGHALDRELDRRVAFLELRHQRQHLVVRPAHPDDFQRRLLRARDMRHGERKRGGEAGLDEMTARERGHDASSQVLFFHRSATV